MDVLLVDAGGDGLTVRNMLVVWRKKIHRIIFVFVPSDVVVCEAFNCPLLLIVFNVRYAYTRRDLQKKKDIPGPGTCG